MWHDSIYKNSDKEKKELFGPDYDARDSILAGVGRRAADCEASPHREISVLLEWLVWRPR